MKLALIAFLASVAAASEHAHLRSTGRQLQIEPFDQNTVIEFTNDNVNLASACIEGQFKEGLVEVEAGRKQFPIDVAVGQQCFSACDCEFRCCSNYPYYISLNSHFEGIADPANPKGGVCVNALSADYTTAAEQPTCSYGISNMPLDDGTGPVPTEGSVPVPTEGTDVTPVVDSTPAVENLPAASGCLHNGVLFEQGESFVNQCNGCQCLSDGGVAACSTQFCNVESASCVMEDGTAYWEGELYMNDCNTCECTVAEDGTAVSICTMMACDVSVEPSQ